MAEYNPVLTAPEGANKKRKIVGRGSSSGLGTTAGKGNKGAQSRSGSPQPYVGFEGGQMPLYRRIAQRGFSNYPFKVEFDVVNLCDIEAKYADGETVNKETLIAKKLIKANKSKNLSVKLLGTGNLTKKVTVSLDKVSKSAKEKVEKAGGSVVEVKKAEKTEKKD
ncbi:MAG: 50S ribosomal protein L15 [Treponema sp.]|nr:50S ribosomal protein L15 [Treponema sp.]